MKHARLVMLVR